MRRLRFAPWFAALWLLFVATPAGAIVTYDGDAGSVVVRGAVDLNAGFSHAPKLDLLYPQQTEGLYSATVHLLLESTIGDHVALEFHGYQQIRHQPQAAAAMISGSAPYRSDYLDVDWLEGHSDSWSALIALDKLMLTVYADPVDIRIGRMPIGLGVNYVFSPADSFYPFDPSQVDREFRPGVDAARVDIRTGMLSMVSLIAVMGYGADDTPSFEKSAFIARASYNAGGWDWTAIGGKTARDYMAGVLFSGEGGPLGMRGEVTVKIPHDNQPQDWYTQAAFSIGHRFENTLHIVGEYYYRGNGSNDAHAYIQTATSIDWYADPYFGKHYAALMLTGEVIPIVTLQGVVLANLSDPSVMLSPGVTISAADEISLSASLTVPLGRTPRMVRSGLIVLPQLRSEYGTYPITAFVQGRFYF